MKTLSQSNMLNQGFMLPFLIGVMALGGLMLLFSLQSSQKLDRIIQTYVEREELVRKLERVPQVATDPSFKEVKGQLLPGIPGFPVYPGAVLVGSAKISPEGKVNLGHRAKWTSKDSVPKIMEWYGRELPKSGWKYEAPDDPKSEGEQVARIAKGDLNGYVAAEIEGKDIEIVLDIKKN